MLLLRDCYLPMVDYHNNASYSSYLAFSLLCSVIQNKHNYFMNVHVYLLTGHTPLIKSTYSSHRLGYYNSAACWPLLWCYCEPLSAYAPAYHPLCVWCAQIYVWLDDSQRSNADTNEQTVNVVNFPFMQIKLIFFPFFAVLSEQPYLPAWCWRCCCLFFFLPCHSLQIDFFFFRSVFSGWLFLFSIHSNKTV